MAFCPYRFESYTVYNIIEHRLELHKMYIVKYNKEELEKLIFIDNLSYEEIGRKYYEIHKDDDELLMEEIPVINGVFSEIKQMQMKISQLKGRKVCPICEEGMELNARYCTKCGNRWENIYEEE